MTDKCKGRTYDRNIPWGDKRVPCRRNAGPSGYCHQHAPRPTEPDESLGVLHSLRYSAYGADLLAAEDVPILSRTAKVCRVKADEATAYKDSANISNGTAVLQSDDRTIVVVGDDKAAVSAQMRNLLAERKADARRELDRWCMAQLELAAMEAMTAANSGDKP